MDLKGNLTKIRKTRWRRYMAKSGYGTRKDSICKKETKITIPEDTRLISFLGGKTIIYILSALILIGILIFTMDTISFIFKLLQIMLSTVKAPVILAIVFYYILRIAVDLPRKKEDQPQMATSLVRPLHFYVGLRICAFGSDFIESADESGQ